MRHAGLIALFCVAYGGAVARAGVVTFDFNSLGSFSHDLAISSYMSEVYGSTVTTDGARATNDRTDVVEGERNLFIATSFQLLDRGDFEILFGELPIEAARFEGHVIDATLGDDFSFVAYDGLTEVFSFSRDDGVEIFDSGWLNFSTPVDRLVISDTGRKDVGIDDLQVQPVPDPSTGVLALVGLAAIRRRRSNRL